MKKGIFDAAAVYFPLYAEALEPVLRRRIPLLYEAAEHADAVGKIVLYHKIEQHAGELIEDLDRLDAARKMQRQGDMFDDEKYRQEEKNLQGVIFATTGYDPDMLMKYIQAAAARYRLVLTPYTIVNKARFVFVEDDDDMRFPRDVTVFGRGKALSIDNGRVVAKINGSIISPGVDMRGTRSMRTDYERMMFDKIVRTVLEEDDSSHLQEIAEQWLHDLEKGRVDKRSLVYKVSPRTEWYNYSMRANKREKVRIAREKELRKGEKYEFGCALVEGFTVEAPVEQFMQGETAVERYKKRFFGREDDRETIGDLLEVVLGHRFV